MKYTIFSPLSRRGSTLPLVVVLLSVLMGMVAFAVDIGFIAAQRTALQRTADAGALAGASQLAIPQGQTVNYAIGEATIRQFVSLNEKLEVLDEDIVFGRYNPVAPAGSRFVSNLAGNPANAVRVRLRRDDRANGPLNLFFAPVLGHRKAEVRVTAVVTVQPGVGLLSGKDLLPYALNADYFYSALGQIRPGVDPASITDKYTVHTGQAPKAGPDGIKEIVATVGGKSENIGSVDIGSKSNGTPELARQILNGASDADFANKDFASKLTKGVLYAPNSFGGDPGVSSGVKDEFASIIGQQRIIPLYTSLFKNGNNSVYTISEFAAVTVVDVDFKGQPKRVIFQPTGIFSSNVSPSPPPSSTAPPIIGVYLPPQLIIP